MYKTILTAGFAMFSMFFGSGNLVFPLLLGTQTLFNYNYAMIGFTLTAVIVPFLGLISMIVYHGDRERFFSTLGRNTGFVLTFIMLALIGPFGVIPRCITVAYGGLQLILPHLSFPLLSAVFCGLTGLLIWRPGQVVTIIGLILTPFKLGGIAVLILFGLYFAEPVTAVTMLPKDALFHGLGLGYQTMDLIAAFFFSATIVQYLREKQTKQGDFSQLFKASMMASLIGAALLSIIYFGFITLGADYASHLHTTSPEALLAAIAGLTMGPYALMIVSATLAISCLATAVILANIFVEFLKNDIMLHRFKRELKQSHAIVGTLLVTFGISLLGFGTICQVLGMILQVAYPALIVLAVHHILTYWFHVNWSKPLFWGMFTVSAVLTWFL